MELTAAQLAVLKTDIAGSEFATYPPDGDSCSSIATAYNLAAAPAYVVWRSTISVVEIMESSNFRWVDIDVLTPGKARIWEWMTTLAAVNPSKSSVQQGIKDCWGATSTQTNSILALCKRDATRAEKLFATGAGTTAAPSVLGWEGSLTNQQVLTARSLP